MTKTEIIDFMRENEGIKVTHFLFTPEEYLYMKNGVVYSEEGYIFEDFYSEHRCDGLRIRSGNMWQNGWKLWRELQD